MKNAAVSLEDKYELDSGRVYLNGTQALVRLLIMQHQRDQRAGLNTAGFVSGYRGSPVGSVDVHLWRAEKYLKDRNILFNPGLNEELGVTTVWGSQQAGIFGGGKYDGVFGLWYGKGPGLDRTGDAMKHANNAGTAKFGGVLACAGDDHLAKSSSLANQCEYTFADNMMPVLNPASVQDYLDFGLYGWALSRYSGLWVGFKCTTETIDSSASCHVDPHRIEIVEPTDFEMPEAGLNIRYPEGFIEIEERLHRDKIPAAQAFVRANKLDKIVIDSPKARLGILTAGKSYFQVRQALDDLGVSERDAAEMGIRLYKVAMTWPVEPEGILNFAKGLEEILVVEEKRPLLEDQAKTILYNMAENRRPTIYGKRNEAGETVLRSWYGLPSEQVAKVVGEALLRHQTNPELRQRLGNIESRSAAAGPAPAAQIKRLAYFCSGCPHNTSTKLPEGSRAGGGIGCHVMAMWMDRETLTFATMGAEGTHWIGESPFVETDHIFQNLGEGTYYHSGILGIRAAVAAEVNITFKILYNDAVAMTGGQPVDGPLTIPQITNTMIWEGAKKVVIVTDEPEKYKGAKNLGAGVTVHHRKDLDYIQKQFREIKGLSVIVYDQTCAAEKRRRRKKNEFPDPPKRAFINELVCEGCGDCGVKSNCVSVQPVETELGRKRMIDQSACNKDYSCIEGFCPSFVTVHDGAVRKRMGVDAEESHFDNLPEPSLPALDEPFGIFIAGIGGTGVITVGALLGMAAHMEGKGVSVLDNLGASQKNGAVTSHVRIANTPEDIHSTEIGAGRARLLLGCDLVVAADTEAMTVSSRDATHAVINARETITGDFARLPDLEFPGEGLRKNITDRVGAEDTEFVEASRLATALLGDSIGANLFMLGVAYQRGLVPLTAASIDGAIELNGVAIEMNRRAFLWGRRAAHDLEAVKAAAAPADLQDDVVMTKTTDEIVAHRKPHLTGFQNAELAARYEKFVRHVEAEEKAKTKGMTGLAEAVARYYSKLLAYKDEYEVARLYTDGQFMNKLHTQFEGDFKIKFHLAPPLFAERDKGTGELRKRPYGQWAFGVFKLLAKLKFLRNTAFDPFGYSEERKRERQAITDYEAVITELLGGLDHDNHALAVEIAEIPDQIRGYGHVKEKRAIKARAHEAELVAAFRDPGPKAAAAE